MYYLVEMGRPAPSVRGAFAEARDADVAFDLARRHRQRGRRFVLVRIDDGDLDVLLTSGLPISEVRGDVAMQGRILQACRTTMAGSR